MEKMIEIKAYKGKLGAVMKRKNLRTNEGEGEETKQIQLTKTSNETKVFWS